MTPILIILGFIALYVVARRMASLKRPRPMGFYVLPKKTFWQKLLGR